MPPMLPIRALLLATGTALAASTALAAGTATAEGQSLPASPAPLGRGLDADTIVVVPPAGPTYAGTTMPLGAELRARGDLLPGGAPIAWTSNRVDRAWVTQDGVLVLLAPGEVTLAARHGRLESRLTLHVREHPGREVTLTSDAGAIVRTDEEVRFTAVVRDGRGKPVAGAPVHYAISMRGLEHAASAAIGADGRFSASEPGLYTVAAASGRVAATRSILVSPRASAYAAAPPVRVRKIAIDGVEHEPLVGTVIPLRARVWLDGGRGPSPEVSVAWTSSDPRVAQVDEHGVVALEGSGSVTITARAGDRSAQRKLSVRRDGAADIALTVNTGDLRVGDAIRLREEAWRRGGMPVRGARVNYAVVAHGGARTADVAISEDRVLTARAPGTYTIIAELGGLAEQTTVVVRQRDGER